MNRSVLTAAAAMASLGVAVAGCGSSSKSKSDTSAASSAPATSTPTTTTSSGSGGTSAGAASTVPISADPSGALAFTKSAATAKAGTVTLAMSNPASLQHGIAIEGNGVSKIGPIVSQGATSKVTVTLKPGTYTFYCPVPGHRQAGMQGTLTVH